ncbi:unnamed protein product [Clonostachys byssicola]|uniref:DUF4604 domain-containing protein n=1 Tax=Clonostachys byssicola TaxID=160290 RepID=A0A9N9UNP7_9HYPO|nr:unnamed protein product [Clonostachys byssicola]
MSQKITSKNLSYDNSLPPFLAALRRQTAGDDEARKPSIGNRQLGKKRSASEEAEDGPVVVDEEGNVMSVEIDKDGTVKEVDGKEGDDDVKADASAKKEGDGAKTSTIGGRKRKVGKVIGEAAAQADDAQGKKDQKQTNKEPDDPPKEKKPKKKVKKIKLSFDEEEDG